MQHKIAGEAEISNSELAHWLAFHQLSGPGIGPQRVIALYERFGSLIPAWQASAGELRQIEGFTPEIVEKFIAKRREIFPEDLLEKVMDSDVKAYPHCHDLYPFRLREIADPPLVLFVKGNLWEEDLRHVAGVVGTRKPTKYGEKIAKDIAGELAEHGITVISGMALGIDSLSHWGAIQAGGKTIAVVGTGPDVCYPSSNKILYDKIIDENCGAIVSEYFPGTQPEKWHFPARNRIIAGISEVVVVVEAGATSGAIITAKQAFEQGREVFAIPGRIDSEMSAGTNKLITDNYAKLISGCEDILKDKDWVKVNAGALGREVPTVVQLFGREKEIYELISYEPIHFDVICDRTGIEAGELSATLTMLELAGIIVRETGDWYSRKK